MPLARAGTVCAACEASVRLMRPPYCRGCGRTSDSEGCTGCGGERFHHDRAHVAAVYEGELKEWMHAYKFAGRRSLAKFFSRLLSDCARERFGETRFDAVIAVPLDPEKKRERSYNQSELLSRAVAKELGLPDLSSSAGRVRSEMAQHRLGRSGRAVNVRDRFFVKYPERVRGKSLLVVDDVLTTGRTVSEFARALKEAGAARVEAIAVAGGFLS
jgi:ComF family protein